MKALEGRLERVRNLYKWGDIGQAEFERDKAAIEAEMAELRSLPTVYTIRQSSKRIGNIVEAWNDATADQRARLASSMVSELWVTDRTITAVRPRPGWAPYFEELLKTLPRERETGLEAAAEPINNQARCLFGISLLVEVSLPTNRQ
jgi:hypothetical protein